MLSSIFEGQIGLFTASTSGIGLAAAEIFAEGGARTVVVNGRDPEAGARAVARIRLAARPARPAWPQGGGHGSDVPGLVAVVPHDRPGRQRQRRHLGGLSMTRQAQRAP